MGDQRFDSLAQRVFASTLPCEEGGAAIARAFKRLVVEAFELRPPLGRYVSGHRSPVTWTSHEPATPAPVASLARPSPPTRARLRRFPGRSARQSTSVPRHRSFVDRSLPGPVTRR